ATERCPSGLRSATGNRVGGVNLPRGFESLPLRSSRQAFACSTRRYRFARKRQQRLRFPFPTKGAATRGSGRDGLRAAPIQVAAAATVYFLASLSRAIFRRRSGLARFARSDSNATRA